MCIIIVFKFSWLVHLIGCARDHRQLSLISLLLENEPFKAEAIIFNTLLTIGVTSAPSGPSSAIRQASSLHSSPSNRTSSARILVSKFACPFNPRPLKYEAFFSMTCFPAQ